MSDALTRSQTVVSYGVEIPGNEGRASMITIVSDTPDDVVDTGALYQCVQNKLPSYARPIFVRLANSRVEQTGILINITSIMQQIYILIFKIPT